MTHSRDSTDGFPLGALPWPGRREVSPADHRHRASVMRYLGGRQSLPSPPPDVRAPLIDIAPSFPTKEVRIKPGTVHPQRQIRHQGRRPTKALI
jgi:hypothetical protein